jgi:Secretion system C-terminal sorting domain
MKKNFIILTLFMGIAHAINAQWQPTEGINGARIYASIATGSNLLLGTSNGVYLSADNGSNWRSASKGLEDNYFANGATNFYVNSFDVKGSKIYASTGKGIFTTTDNGSNWTFLGLKNFFASRVVISGSNIYVSAQEGIFVSNNEGITWTSITNGLPPTLGGYSLAVEGANLYAASFSGFYTSTNNGTTWAIASNGLSGNYATPILKIGATLYMGTSDDLFSSTDNGLTWTRSRFYQGVFSLTSSGSNIYAGSVNNTVYISNDNGANWDLKGNGIKKGSIYTLNLMGSTLLAGTAGSLYASTNNGDTWKASNKGLSDFPMQAIAPNQTSTLAGSGYGELFASSDNGANWTTINNNLNNLGVYSLDTFGGKFFASVGIDIYQSANNGVNWTLINSGLEAPIVNNSSKSSTFSLAPNATNLFAGNVNGVYLFKPNTNTWTQLPKNVMDEDWQVGKLTINGENMYAAGLTFRVANNVFSTSYGIFQSTNNGNNWRRILTSSNQVGNVVNSGSKILASTYGGGIIVSDNNGNSWTEANNGLTNLKTSNLLKYGNILFTTAYRGGIFYSTNDGNNWRSANDGLPTKIIYKLSVSGNYLLVGTDMGIFRRPLSEFSTVGTKENKEELSYSIFPNPVSNTLTINCSDALIGKNYSIKNILGETIQAAILTDNSTQLSVQNFANGIYFLTLIGTNKMVKFVKE